jgi:tetratricopeptide (TPR) repeat protein
MLKSMIALLILSTVLVSLEHCVGAPYRCNRLEKAATASLMEMERGSLNRLQVAPLARKNIERLQQCLSTCPDDVGMIMVLAGSYRFLGNPERAVSLYRYVLRYEQRPEVYFNLGMSLIEAGGDREQAVENLKLAAIYDPSYLKDIVLYRSEVLEAVEQYQARLQAARNRS